MTRLIEKRIDGSQIEYLGVEASTGASEAGEFPVLNTAGKLDITLLPDGVGADIVQFTASEDMIAGAYFYVLPSGEIANADSTSIAKKAIGFVTEAVSAGGAVKAQFDDSNNFLTGLSIGQVYFLSDTTAGAVTLTAPVATGTIVQSIGVATSATSIHSDIDSNPVIRA